MESSRNRESGMEVGAWPRHVTALIGTLGMHVACGPAAWLMVTAQAVFKGTSYQMVSSPCFLELAALQTAVETKLLGTFEEAISFLLLSNTMTTLSSFPSCLF